MVPRPRPTTRPVLSCLAAAILCASVSAQLCTDGPPTTIGTATVLLQGLPAATKLPNSTVEVLRIDCEGLPSIGVQVQISEPPAGVPLRGTLLLGSGAKGVSFFSAEFDSYPLCVKLQALGFRLVDRAWVTGWFSSNAGVRKQSCRYGTLLDWVHRNVHTRGVFGALGSSGGSAEIGYALTTWGAGDDLDMVVLVGGPPISRLDLSCQQPPSPAWQAQCASLVPPNVMECPTLNCGLLTGFNVCTACSPNPTPTELREDSILHTTATLDFPGTYVHIVLGAADCWGTVPSAMLFFQAIGAEKVVEFVPKTTHFVTATPQGEDAVLRAVLGGAASRPGPATLAYQSWPRVGGPLHLDLLGSPNDPFLVLGAAGIQNVEVPPFGWLFLSTPFVQGRGWLDPLGNGGLDLVVPPIPALAGLEVFQQAVVGSALTNLIRFQVLR